MLVLILSVNNYKTFTMFTIRIKSLFLAVIVFGIISSAFSTVPSGYYYFVKNKKKAELKTAIHTYCTPLK